MYKKTPTGKIKDDIHADNVKETLGNSSLRAFGDDVFPGLTTGGGLQNAESGSGSEDSKDRYASVSVRIREMLVLETTDEQKAQRLFVQLGMEFQRAARRGNVKKVQRFIDEGFPVNFRAPDTQQTALHCCAGSRARGTFDVLTSTNECDYLAKDFKGRLASEIAYQFGQDEEMERILLEKEREQAERDGIELTYRPRY